MATSGVRPEPQSVLRGGWLITAAITAALVCFAAFAAAVRPAWAITANDVDWWLPSSGNGAYVAAVALASLATFVAFWLRPSRRRQLWRSAGGIPSFLLSVILSLVGMTFVLGFASFAPCATDGVRVLSPLTETLMLFLGDGGSDLVGPFATTECDGATPLATQLARFTGIAATFIGAAAVLLAISREQLARWVIRASSDIDVVIGLDDLSLPLVRSLVAESDGRLREDWHDRTWREKVRPQVRTRVAVIHAVRDDSLAAAAIEVGATVLVGDATDPRVLRPALQQGRKTSLRRLFAVSSDQESNIAVADIARAALSTAFTASASDLVQRTKARPVPRIVLRLDDPREARDWRLAHLGGKSWFEDAVTTGDLAAGRLCDAFVALGTERLLVVGDTALSIALLDTIAWRTWTATSLGERAPQHRLRTRSVTLAGDRADRVRAEWESRRSPASSAEGAPSVTTLTGDWEAVAERLFTVAERAAIVVTDATEDSLVRATRIARLLPGVRVFAADATLRGFSDPSTASVPWPGVVRFGPVLVEGSQGRVPEDSWTQLARLQHARFAEQPRPARRPWDGDVQRGVPRLAEFFREDNLRQHRAVLSALGSEWAWTPASAVGPAPEGLPLAELQRIAHAEHERWLALRVGEGWSGIDPGADPLDGGSRDQRRLNESVRDWHTGELAGRSPVRNAEVTSADRTREAQEMRDYNVDALRLIIEALWYWGVSVSPASAAAGALVVQTETATRFRRTGTVWAWRLAEVREWQNSNGDSLRAEPGDWWVVSPDGRQRSVASDVFADLYVQVDGQLYRRSGEVTARRVHAWENVMTLEGAAHAKPGDWIVSDAASSWPVPDTDFRAGYSPVPWLSREHPGSMMFQEAKMYD